MPTHFTCFLNFPLFWLRHLSCFWGSFRKQKGILLQKCAHLLTPHTLFFVQWTLLIEFDKTNAPFSINTTRQTWNRRLYHNEKIKSYYRSATFDFPQVFWKFIQSELGADLAGTGSSIKTLITSGTSATIIPEEKHLPLLTKMQIMVMGDDAAAIDCISVFNVNDLSCPGTGAPNSGIAGLSLRNSSCYSPLSFCIS